MSAKTFKFLNPVIDCYKPGVNIMMTLWVWVGRSLQFQFSTPIMNIMEVRCGSFLLAGRILCATVPWSNVKISLGL